MSRTLLALGVLSALAAAGNAMGLMGGGGLNVYPMRIVGNSSSGYNILAGDKPPGDIFEVAFDGEIRWDFTNNTNPPETVRFRMGELEFNPADCPVNWTGCEFLWPNLLPGNTKQVSATPRKAGDSYSFNLYVGKSDGPFQRIDPELQIDDYSFVTWLLALLSLIFFGASWWTGASAGAKRAQLKQ